MSFCLNYIYEHTFALIKKLNNGILVIYDNKDTTLEVLSDFNVTNRDKLSLLLDSSMLDQDEKSNANVCSECINGKITVRRGTASLYMSMMERLEQVFKAHNLEERIFSSVKYSIQVKNSGKRISYIAKSQVENEVYEKELSEISKALYESVRDNFKEFLSSKEINGYDKPLSPQSVFKYIEWLCYNALLNIDFSDVKRDRDALSELVKYNESILNVKKAKTESISIAPKSDIELKSFEEMLMIGYTPLKIARALVDNDNALYNLGDNHDNEGSPELWASFRESYPDTFEFLVHNGKIIGNYSLVALTDQQIDELLTGNLVEADFSVEDNDALVWPGVYNLYLLNFSVNIGYNTIENYNMLWQALVEKIEKYAGQGIYFEKIYVNTFRADHRKLYQKLGFKRINHEGAVRNTGVFYEIDFPDGLKWPKENLLKLYKNR